MQLHDIKKQIGKISRKPKLGRGGKRGKTCGHGHKGQKQHGRHGIRPEMRDFIKKLPKLRGYGVNRASTVNADKAKPVIVKLSEINDKKLTEVTPETLLEAGIITKRGNKIPKIKLLADTAETIKINVEGCLVSASVQEAIQKAGGSVK